MVPPAGQIETADTHLRPYIDYMSEGKLPGDTKHARRFVLESPNYFLDEDLLLRHKSYMLEPEERAERKLVYPSKHASTRDALESRQ